MTSYMSSSLLRLRENSQYFVIITRENKAFAIETLGFFRFIELADG